MYCWSNWPWLVSATHVDVQELVLRALLDVVPGGGVVLLVPHNLRRGSAAVNLPSGSTARKTSDDHNGDHLRDEPGQFQRTTS